MKKSYDYGEEEFCVPECDAQESPQAAWDSLIGSLCHHKNNNKIAIEFDCGGCCKKVLNGERLIPIVGLGVVVLLPDRGDHLLVKLFGEDAIIERQLVRAIVIPIDRICSVEFGAVEIDAL